jgi:hypothetical protein
MICKGIITDLVGQPIPKAIITIKSIRGATSITSSVYFHQCDDKGEYNFSLLEGKYKIWIQNSNFSDKNLVGVGVIESDTPDGDIDSILVAEDVPTPDKPIEPTTSDVTYTEKTFTPIYFYITLDDTAKELTDSEVEELIKYTDVSVLSSEGFSYSGNYGYDNASASIPKQFPLIYLGKTTEGYKYAFPYPLADTRDTSYPDHGHTKYIYIQLHNILSKYNTDGSSLIHGVIKTNGTRIYRDSIGVGGKWPSTNKITLALASDNYNIYPNLNWDYSLGSPPLQDTAKVYYYKHIANDIEATPMTFKFIDTVKISATDTDTDDDNTNGDNSDNDNLPQEPNGELTDYTVKVTFTPTYWHDNEPRFAIYNIDTQTWKESVKVENNIVWFSFTEEEANSDCTCIFTRHNPSSDEISWSTLLNQTNDIVVSFDTEILNDVVTIDVNTTTQITVGSAYI